MGYDNMPNIKGSAEPSENQWINSIRFGQKKENIRTSSSVTNATGGNMLFAAKIDIIAKRLEKEAKSVAEQISSQFSSWKPTTKSLEEFIRVENWVHDSEGILDETPELEYIRMTKSAKYSIKVVALNVDMNHLLQNAKQDILNWLGNQDGELDDDAYGNVLSRCIKTDKNGMDWYYNMDTESWDIADCSEVRVMESSELAVLQYTEKWYRDGIDPAYADELEQIASCFDCSTAQELEEILTSNKMILELRNRTQPYTKLQAIQTSEEDITLAVLPDDPRRVGFAVYTDQEEYVLCQYITSDIINPKDPSEIPDKIVQEALSIPDMAHNTEAYCREVGRTEDPDRIISKIIDLAERYIRDFHYTVPLSFDATVETEQASQLLDAIIDDQTNRDGKRLLNSERENLKQAADNFLCVLATRRKQDIGQKK